ncbi:MULTISPECIES: hypothetical protein [unclassified Spirillospora]|uniref:hypothetical protein n=1 Tax=unclassified Spirillospora TaxID=2642701 RepID=UPI0037219D35
MNRLLAAVLAVPLALAVSGCETTQRISEGAYRNAVTGGTVDELKAQGIELRERPDCTTPETGAHSVVRVNCTAHTWTGEPVIVAGVAYRADTGRPHESYVVTVGGREVVRKDCLGAGCR